MSRLDYEYESVNSEAARALLSFSTVCISDFGCFNFHGWNKALNLLQLPKTPRNNTEKLDRAFLYYKLRLQAGFKVEEVRWHRTHKYVNGGIYNRYIYIYGVWYAVAVCIYSKNTTCPRVLNVCGRMFDQSYGTHSDSVIPLFDMGHLKQNGQQGLFADEDT